MTVRSSRSAMAGTCPVIFAEKASQAAAGRGRFSGAGAGGVALITVLQGGGSVGSGGRGRAGRPSCRRSSPGCWRPRPALLGRGDPGQVQAYCAAGSPRATNWPALGRSTFTGTGAAHLVPQPRPRSGGPRPRTTARQAVAQAHEARGRDDSDDLLDIGGEFAVSIATHHALAGAALAAIEGAEGDAATELERSTSLYDQGPGPGEQHWFGGRPLAGADLAIVRLRSGALDGARAELEPAFDLPPEQRIADLTTRLAQVRSELAAPVFRGSPQARDLGDQIEGVGPDAEACACAVEGGFPDVLAKPGSGNVPAGDEGGCGRSRGRCASIRCLRRAASRTACWRQRRPSAAGRLPDGPGPSRLEARRAASGSSRCSGLTGQQAAASTAPR